ncbi:hypothetical protein GW796_10670 [archaeon]|nr:hypothetical protein [archaeon]NCQ52325.1 hypothetical protein [archaeon]
MSLTSELSNKTSNIRLFFNNNFTFSPFINSINSEISGFHTLMPKDKNNYPWSDVGHMTEYLMLLHIGLDVSELFPMKFAKNEFRNFYAKTKLKYNDSAPYFKNRIKFKELCNNLYRMSTIEKMYRSKDIVSSLQLNNIFITDSVFQDMINIYFQSLSINPIINNKDNFFCYNPLFDLSAAIGGADADLYLIKPKGNTLLDLKTTIRPQLTEDMLFQLLGYVFLDVSREHKLTSIGVYLTRQNLISDWDISTLISKYSKFETVKEAQNEFVKVLLNCNIRKPAIRPNIF